MRWIAALALIASCADEEKLVALEKKVTELETQLQSQRKDFENRIEDLEADRKDVAGRLEEARIKLEKVEAQTSKFSSMGSTLTQRPQRPEPDRSKTYSVPVDGYPSVGPADAKVTIVKAYDHACPFCEKSRATMKELLARYRGDVRIVYKPLVVHPRNAMAAALATCAAHKQNKFEAMNDMIWDKGFNNGRTLDTSDTGIGTGQAMKCWDHPDGCKHVVDYAKELRLNVTKFKQDMRDCQPSIAQSASDYARLSVAATPAFFINGRFISGAVPVEQFVPVVDEELRKANERIAQGTKKRDYYEQWIVQQGLTTLVPAGGP